MALSLLSAGQARSGSDFFDAILDTTSANNILGKTDRTTPLNRDHDDHDNYDNYDNYDDHGENGDHDNGGSDDHDDHDGHYYRDQRNHKKKSGRVVFVSAYAFHPQSNFIYDKRTEFYYPPSQ